MKRVIYFIGPRAADAVVAFRQAAGLLAGSFDPRVGTSDSDVPPASRVVVWDESLKARFPTATVWPAGDLASQCTQLLAELLGGGGTPPPPPAPKPMKPKSLGTAKVSRETAGRRGKGVTVVSDLPLTEDALKDLCTRLKTKCGSGGTAKDGRIEIQGDHRDAVAAELEKIGYKVKRSGG